MCVPSIIEGDSLLVILVCVGVVCVCICMCVCMCVCKTTKNEGILLMLKKSKTHNTVYLKYGFHLV